MTEWWHNAATPGKAQPLRTKGWPSTQEFSATRAARRTPVDDARRTPAQAAPAAAPRAALDAAARALMYLGSARCTTPSCFRPLDHSGLHTFESSQLPQTRTRRTPSSRLATSELGAYERALVAEVVNQHAVTPPLLHSLAVHMSSYHNEDDAAHRELVRAFLCSAAPRDLPYESFWNAVGLMDLKHDAAPGEGVAAKLTAAWTLAAVASRQADIVTTAIATGLVDRPA